MANLETSTRVVFGRPQPRLILVVELFLAYLN